jgi:hypothetical protein
MREYLIPTKALCAIITGDSVVTEEMLSTLDWQSIHDIARGQGLAEMLFVVLCQKKWLGYCSEAVRVALSDVYYQTTARNTLLMGELDKILRVCELAGIPVMVLKGATLVNWLYPEIGCRPMADLDIMVKDSDWQEALRLIQELDYSFDGRDQVPGMSELSDYHRMLTGGPAGKMIVEVHWGLVSSSSAWYAAPAEWFWQRTMPTIHEGKAVQLAPAANLIHLSAHAMLQHGGSQALLIWLYDIHLLAQSGSVNWDEVIQDARKLRWGYVVAHALKQAQVAFGTKLPPGLLENLNMESDEEIVRLVLFKQRFGGVRLIYDWYSLLALRGGRRLKYALGMIFPQPEYIRWRYQPQPRWLWPAYYPYRWWRMLGEGWLALRKGILRAEK